MPATAKKINYNVASNDGDVTSITAFVNGKTRVAGSTHPNFKNIMKYIDQSETSEGQPLDATELDEMFDVGIVIAQQFNRVSERVMIRDGKVYLDGDEMHNSLSKAIFTFFHQGHESYQPLVNFLEKIELNPNKHSREMLYDWLSHHNFGVCENGDFVAYKGVQRAGNGNGRFMSSHSGTAIVNGVEFVDQRIPTSPGAVVEMARSKVQHSPSVGCSTGLHAGTWGYARGFASVLVQVRINPRDVVSVPTDCSGQKVRVCRYKVLDVVTEQDESILYIDQALKTLQISSQERTPTRKAAVKKKKRTASKKTPAKKAAAKKKPAVRKAPAKKAVAKAATKKKATVKISPAAKKQAAKKKTDARSSKFYEDFKKKDFLICTYREMQWLAKEWDVKLGSSPKKLDYVNALAKEATAIRRRNKKS